ncbi:MAG: restriction endonuclease subunit M [Bacteroidales bacterium]|nr:restriction endonuclease subunit M [Bacteroidales bacterium]MDD7706798.1 restriction endonuclease subunit M [Bacteroidales bacterium]
MRLNIDIIEDDLLGLGGDILQTLLADHTTGRNIIWATHDYDYRGDGFRFGDSITVGSITGEDNHIIMPRMAKGSQQQRSRSQVMAEVFTPCWVCNAQNNLIDDAWFGRTGVFNTENDDNTWTANDKPQIPEGKRWMDYIKDTRLEMACGEAPYLVSRYDATTGVPIPIGERIGMLDRKLWIIHHNTPNLSLRMTKSQKKVVKKKWLRQVYRAYQSVYGYEYQGDNLLLAREAMFVSYIEYYQAKWQTDKLPSMGSMQRIAEIVSCNIWQMDGLSYGIPGQKPTEQLEESLFPMEVRPEQRFCRIREWKGIEPLKGKEIIFRRMLDEK